MNEVLAYREVLPAPPAGMGGYAPRIPCWSPGLNQ